LRKRDLSNLKVRDIMQRAYEKNIVIPAFNIAYLPMLKPIAETLEKFNSFGLMEVARPDWEKFQAQGIFPVKEEYKKYENPEHMRLHLDHTPVIDEDGEPVDWESIIRQALEVGYHSVMIDGSRLPLEDNIKVTRQVVQMARPLEVAVEAELGAVWGHEKGPLPPYEELFNTGQGFTLPQEAKRFVEETEVNWLSVAIGNIHGAISGVAKDMKKLEARLSIPHLRKFKKLTGIPLVLHGGSNIKREYVLEAIRNGIAKINIGTNIRQAYEKGLSQEGGSVAAGQSKVAEEVTFLIRDYFGIINSHDVLE